MELKDLAKLCVEAEKYFQEEGLTIEPRVLMSVSGKKDSEKVPIFKIPEDPSHKAAENIYGQFIAYRRKTNRTSVCVSLLSRLALSAQRRGMTGGQLSGDAEHRHRGCT
ncbi:MAG: hypothetical protein R6U13_13450 [Desulfatiglandaceae bacterium]